MFLVTNNQDNMAVDVNFIVSILVTAYLAVLFLQSGIDKVLNYAGTKAYLDAYFKHTPLAPTVGILTPVITVLEVLAGVLCAMGVFMLYYRHDVSYAQWGVETSAFTLLCLFFGQRMAKDYAGAANLSIYFILTLVGLMMIR
jgi:hypothetical protein